MTTTTTPTAAEIADVLDQAHAQIERVGWHQGYLYDETAAEAGTPLADCPTCAVGAILTTVYGQPRYPMYQEDRDPRDAAAETALQEHVGDAIPEWNDHADRTEAEVLDAFRETAANLRKGAAA